MTPILRPVLRHPSLPLCVCESAREGGERARALFEALGEGVRSLAHVVTSYEGIPLVFYFDAPCAVLGSSAAFT